MVLQDIIKHINRLISNNSSYNLNFDKLEFYIDGAVDHINLTLQTTFMTPREYFNSNFQNIVITTSDKYIGSFGGDDIKYFGDVSDGMIYYQYNDGYYIRENKEWVKSEQWYDFVNVLDLTKTDIKDFISVFNYDVIPEVYIRRCVAYLAAAHYLEEEDELESQYAIYKQKADEALAEWQKIYYSVYDISEANRRYL